MTGVSLDMKCYTYSKNSKLTMHSTSIMTIGGSAMFHVPRFWHIRSSQIRYRCNLLGILVVPSLPHFLPKSKCSNAFELNLSDIVGCDHNSNRQF